MGYHTSLNIAREKPDWLVVIASRSDKNQAAASINATLRQQNTVFMPLDLSDPANVRNFAAKWTAGSSPPLKVLVFNAALQFPAGLVLTPDRMEKTFAIAHVGHAILFHLLAPHLVSGGRVVITASGVHDPAQRSGLPDAEYNNAEELAYPPPSKVKMPGRKRYATAKLCNVMWTYALARHLEQAAPQRRITVIAMDPGLMPGTDLARTATAIERWLWYSVMPHCIGLLRLLLTPNVHTPKESGDNLARLAIGADVEGVTGRYFEGGKEIPSSKDSYVEGKQEDLWEWTINYVAQGDAAKAAQYRAFQ